MPELPEVETVRAHLAARLPGARLKVVQLTRPDLRFAMPAAALKALADATVVAVDRRAKYLLLRTNAATVAPTALVHLGMSGRLFVDDEEPQQWRKHEHWRWQLEGANGPLWLRYVDPRRFGVLDVVAADGHHKLLADLGPEPLGPDFTTESLGLALWGRKVPVKVALMDAAVVVGVGNIYASEACWRAQVSPLRPACAVSEAEVQALVAAVRAVLHEAIAAGGSTLRDFVGGDEAPGYFQQRLDAYGREGEPCHRCPPAPARCIARTVVGQRATFWCPACQA